MTFTIAVLICAPVHSASVWETGRALSPDDRVPGPEWIAEVSEVDPPHVGELTITLPAGAFATVGIYGSANRPEATTPDSVSQRTFVQHTLHRRVNVGTPHEREAVIPEFLIPEKWLKPDGLWSIQFHVTEPGVFEVPIECLYRKLTLTLDVRDPVPKPDIGYGLYGNRQNWPDIDRAHEYLRDQVAHGMNTTTVASGRPLPKEAIDAGFDPSNGADVIRWHLDAAADDGLLDPRCPIHCYTAAAAGGGDEDTLCLARVGARHAWPELLADVIPHEAAADAWKSVRDSYNSIPRSFRTTHDTNGDGYWAYGKYVDVPVVHCTTLSDMLLRKFRAEGTDWWAYNCVLRGTNGALNRYWTGLWAWVVRPHEVLTWTYIHNGWAQIDEDGTLHLSHYHDRALSTPDGPVPSVGFEGLRDGIVDYMVLRELERLIESYPHDPTAWEAIPWMASLEQGVDTRWPDLTNGTYYWDNIDLALPPRRDLGAMRAKALDYIDRLRGASQ